MNDLYAGFFFINDFHNYMIQNAVNARQIVFIRGKMIFYMHLNLYFHHTWRIGDILL